MTSALSSLFRIAPQRFKSSRLSINNCTREAEMTTKKSSRDPLLRALIGWARDEGTFLSHPYVSSYGVSCMVTGTITASDKSRGWYWTHVPRRSLSQKATTFLITDSKPKERNRFEIFFPFLKLGKIICIHSPGALFFVWLNWDFNLEPQSEGIIVTHAACSFHRKEYSRVFLLCIV